MTTSERIAAAIKPIIDEDRRADRERIAALERSIGFLNLRVSNEEERANRGNALVDDLNKQIDELAEKCAALVLEKELARGELVKLRSYAVEHGRLPVETPAVKQEEQGPWVVYDKTEKYGLPWSGPFGCWREHVGDLIPWNSRTDAEAWVRGVEKDTQCNTGWTVITLAEARAIEAKR